MRHSGLSPHFFRNVKYNLGENLQKRFIMFILSLKWMQSRQARVPGMEGIPSLDRSDGQFGLWIILGCGNCDQEMD